MNVTPRPVTVVGKQRPKLLPCEDTSLFLPFLNFTDTSRWIAVNFLPVQCFPEYHLYYTKRLVHRCRGTLCQKSRTQVKHIRTGDLGGPFVDEAIWKNVLLEPLTLNLCVTPGDALSFLTQPAYVRAAIPVEERLGILAKCDMTWPPVGFLTLK
jgi:hypothetical protein